MRATKNRLPLTLLLVPLAFCLCADSCTSGDILSSSSDSNVDNSTDNSQHGISSCDAGSTFTCAQDGPHSFTQSEQCVNVNGDTVTLNGPEPINENLAAACPTPTPVPTPEPVVL